MVQFRSSTGSVGSIGRGDDVLPVLGLTDLKSAALLLEKCGKKCERGYVGLSTNST